MWVHRRLLYRIRKANKMDFNIAVLFDRFKSTTDVACRLVCSWIGPRRVAFRSIFDMFDLIVRGAGEAIDRVQGTRQIHLLLACFGLWTKLSSFDSWTSSVRTLLMAQLRPSDIWPRNPDIYEGGNTYFSKHTVNFDAVALEFEDIGALRDRCHTLVHTVAILMARIMERDSRISRLERDLSAARSKQTILEGEKTLLHRERLAVINYVQRQKDVLATTRQHVRNLLVGTLILWRYSCTLSGLLSKALLDLQSSTRTLETLNDERERAVLRDNTQTAAISALETRIQKLEISCDIRTADAKQWFSICRFVLSTHFVKMDEAILAQTRSKQTMAGLLTLMRLLWRYLLILRQQAAEAEAAQSLRKENAHLEELLIKRNANMLVLMRYKDSCQRRMECLLVCLLVLWRYTRVLGRQLAQAQVRLLACPVLCKPNTLGLEYYYAAFSPGGLLQVTAGTDGAPSSPYPSRGPVHDNDDIDLSNRHLQELSGQQRLAIRFAQMHTAYSSVAAQRDEVWAALQKAEATVEQLREDQRNTTLALAVLHKSTVKLTDVRAVKMALRPAEPQYASSRRLTAEELFAIEAKISEVLSQYAQRDGTAGPVHDVHRLTAADTSMGQHLTLSANLQHDAFSWSPHPEPAATSQSPVQREKEIAKTRAPWPHTWNADTLLYTPTPAADADEDRSCAPDDLETSMQELADQLQLLDFYDEEEELADEGVTSREVTMRSPPAETRVHSLVRPLFSVPAFKPEFLAQPVPFTPHASWYQSQSFFGNIGGQAAPLRSGPSNAHERKTSRLPLEAFAEIKAEIPRTANHGTMSSIGPARTANICMRTEAGRSTGSSCHNQLTYSSTIARLGASTADNDREHPQPQISIGVIRARAPSTLVQADPIRTGVAVHPGISFLWRTGNSGPQGAGADAETCYHKCEPVNENVSQGEAVRAREAITPRGRLTIRDPQGAPRRRQGRPWQWRRYQDELPAGWREGAAVYRALTTTREMGAWTLDAGVDVRS
ncbi:predicted protein [Postia placenta Mad-698-R]|uniref:Uncharacterized protein n=1 Tax=Postia placenta MAD-698-R-SB12 TaxID=670580 RepID=A0A1X6N698_9APHY|nr:hypothetical protein POSPLADRAFT_1045156 [Postia placenta MAD-698-R-SB12]EED81876.1 predicted protein [Postia placenta Mad-698-R]OSX64022.1 hypothetical protein POSPLADRAFT_1045156 [Postia placenta MAD-698-R-SB12]